MLGIAFAVWGILQAINPIQKRLHRVLKDARAVKLTIISLWLCITVLLVFPLGSIMFDDINSVTSGFDTQLDVLCAKSPDDAYLVAAYLNGHI